MGNYVFARLFLSKSVGASEVHVVHWYNNHKSSSYGGLFFEILDDCMPASRNELVELS